MWSAIETVGTLAIGLASVVVIARLIGPDAFGLASIGLGLVLVLVVLIPSLVHDGLVRSPDLGEVLLASALTFSALAAAVAGLGLALLAQLLARLLDEPRLVGVLLALLPMLLFSALASPLVAERRRALDFRTVGRHQLFSRGLGLAAGIAVAVTGGGVWSVVVQQLLTTGLLLLTLCVARRALPRPQLDWRALGPVLRFSQFIAWTGLVVQLTERVFLTLAGYLYGIAAAGQWAVASRLVETVTTVMSQLIYHVGLAHMAPLRSQAQRLAAAMALGRDALILALLPLLVGIAAAAEPLVALLFGAGWTLVPALVVWLLLGAVFVVRRLFAQVALNVLGRSETTLYAFAAEGLAGLAMLAVLAPFGLIGAAAARALSFAVGWLVIHLYARRALPLDAGRETLALGLDLAVAVAGFAAVEWLLAGAVFPHAGVEILARGTLAAGLVLGLLAILRRGRIRELLVLLASWRQR